MTLSGTHVGKFWLAGAPEAALAGRYTSGAGLTPVVEVLGELGPSTLQAISQEPADDDLLTVHGDLFGSVSLATLMNGQRPEQLLRPRHCQRRPRPRVAI
jgi:hypothetical protein